MLIKVKNHYGERMYRNAFTGKAVKIPHAKHPTKGEPDLVLQRLMAPKIAKMSRGFSKAEKLHYQNLRFWKAFRKLYGCVKAVKVLDQDLKSDFIKASKRVNQNPWTILHNLGLA